MSSSILLIIETIALLKGEGVVYFISHNKHNLISEYLNTMAGA